MVNYDRIVPITKIDYLSMIGTSMKLAGTSFAVLGAADVEGNFSATGTGDIGNKLANQPVKTLNFASGVTAAVVYFVAAYDFAGFTVNGAAATMGSGSATVKKDGVTLYTATLGSGEVTVAAVTPEIA